MDNPANNDPLAPKSVFGSNWIKKKTRYEDDDLSLTPPDDSSFFSLRFGAQRNKPNESMYDRINKELGLSVESSNSHVTPELNIAPASIGRDGHSAQILLGPSGLVLERTRRQQSSTSVSVISSSDDTPRIVVPATILERKEEQSASAIGGPDSPENSLVAQQDIETLVSKVRGGRPTRKISMNLAETIDRKFLESVHELKIEPSESIDQVRPMCPVLPTVTADASSLIDSIPVVSAIRDRRRKTSAPPSLNPMKASNFFFTGGLFSTVATTSASTMASSEAPASLMQQDTSTHISQMKPSALSEPTSPLKQIIDNESNTDGNFTLAQTTSLMEDRASEAASLEPKSRMGKRRPKASALREMNFWAPQSM